VLPKNIIQKLKKFYGVLRGPDQPVANLPHDLFIFHFSRCGEIATCHMPAGVLF
jgi:hypothetical protein